MFDSLQKKKTGNAGESLAVKFLQRNGYRILARNFLIRGGEIDIVAKDKDGLAFVEVKTRFTHEFGLPEESITYHKMQALQKTALFYLMKHNLGEQPYRFDLVAVDYAESKDEPKVSLIRNIS